MAPKPIKAKPEVVRSVLDLKPALVTWDDAYIQVDFDGPITTTTEGDKLRNETLAFVVSLNKRRVKLCFERSPETNTVRYLYTIPTKYIVSIVPLAPERLVEPEVKEAP